MTQQTRPIAECNNFIVLDRYTKIENDNSCYQSEFELENELIQDLRNQGYESISIKSQEAMLANVREQLEMLNNVTFLDTEWRRFVETWLDNPNDGIVEKTRKIHDDYVHDFTFDNGRIQNIYLVDKKNLLRNKVQVIRQFEQTGTHTNRYDVTILINGLPLVHIELKKRGVAIREAFNQIHRYSKESFNSDNSLFKYLQLFVISNGTDARYFANTTKRDKNSFDFTMNWAKSDNTPIKGLKDFTATFFQKHTLLNVLFKYNVFDSTNTLLVMRPYQIAATERILWKINSSFEAKNWSKPESGGYIWHATGSGKTLTSFKAAQLATQLNFIDKVLFVVDRKDLDYQTIKEYQRFSPDSVNGSNNTAGLKRNLNKDDNKIVVTTIQKLNNLMKAEADLPVYQQQVVFIFDECHRSQFGEAQKNLKKKFKKFYQFGFTGTPIFPENAAGSETTESVFGCKLHSYVIADAIRDEKVLKFKVDYNDVRPKFKSLETETDEEKLSAAETKQAFLHPKRINEITRYILNNFRHKTHRTTPSGKGFNAMLAVSNIQAAKMYYTEFEKQQKERANNSTSYKPLRVATIFSFAANEEQNAIGDIADESLELSAMDKSAREFLDKVIHDHYAYFKANSSTNSDSTNSDGFQNYYRDISNRVKKQEIDLLIVVNMFLTGFDAPTLNTLFVDKNLRYHGLIQAFSRTNRIYGKTKPFGNIVTFRNLEPQTEEAIKMFGGKGSNLQNVVLVRKSYKEYIKEFTDIITELETRFPNPTDIESEKEKKAFVKLFGKYLRVENDLQNYDEYTALKALQKIDTSDPEAVKTFKEDHYLDDAKFASMQTIHLISERKAQDYRSVYNDIREWVRRAREANEKANSTVDWNDVEFEVELLKSLEINLDYILELIYDFQQKNTDKEKMKDEVSRLIRSSLDNRAKEKLVVDFIDQTNLDDIPNKEAIIETFYKSARQTQQREADALIKEEGLNEEAAKRYIQKSLNRGYATEFGTELNDALPKLSPLNPQYRAKKQSVFQKISAFVEKFRGIGGWILSIRRKEDSSD